MNTMSQYDRMHLAQITTVLPVYDEFCTTPYAHWQKLYAHLFSPILSLPEEQIHKAFIASFRKVETAFPQEYKCDERTRKADMDRIHRMKEGLCDFLLNVQIASDDSRIDGGWMRAFDMELGEYFGCAKDIAWGPYSILTGWMTGCIPLCFMELLGIETVYWA